MCACRQHTHPRAMQCWVEARVHTSATPPQRLAHFTDCKSCEWRAWVAQTGHLLVAPEDDLQLVHLHLNERLHTAMAAGWKSKTVAGWKRATAVVCCGSIMAKAAVLLPPCTTVSMCAWVAGEDGRTMVTGRRAAWGVRAGSDVHLYKVNKQNTPCEAYCLRQAAMASQNGSQHNSVSDDKGKERQLDPPLLFLAPPP
jgi:hypothetical protein